MLSGRDLSANLLHWNRSFVLREVFREILIVKARDVVTTDPCVLPALFLNGMLAQLRRTATVCPLQFSSRLLRRLLLQLLVRAGMMSLP